MARHSRNRSVSDDEELPRTPISRDSLREAGQLARYLLPYAFQLAAALVALLLSSFCGLAFPFLVGRLVNSAIAGHEAPSPLPWHQNVNGIALALARGHRSRHPARPGHSHSR